MRRIVLFLATGCGSGYLPMAPGTWGSAVGVGFYWLIRYLPTHAYVATTVAFIVFAIWVSGHAQRVFEEADPPRVVIDEVAGFLVTMAFHRPSLAVVVGGFVLFRVFDIVKPPPIRWIERRFADGRGIVLDDVIAGIYANAVLWFLELVVPALGIKW